MAKYYDEKWLYTLQFLAGPAMDQLYNPEWPIADWLTDSLSDEVTWLVKRPSEFPHFPIGRYSFRMNRRKQFLLCPKGAFTAEPRAQITLSRTESDMWQPTPLLAYTCMVWYTDGWHIKGKTGADLNAWPLQWGGHFAGFVWVHLSL